jgi:uncharacterized protein YjbI with pentapeptide repeats
MPVPQELADLPYADYLQPHEGGLGREGELVELRFDEAEYEDFDAGNSRIRESAFTGVSFTDGSFDRARLSDAWFHRTRWVSTSMVDSDWLDVTILDSFLAGVQAHGSRLRRVTFQECKIDTLNLRGAAVRDVVFDRCELRELDFDEATLTNVTFPGSALRRVILGKATLKKVDFRGATELGLVADSQSLQGAVIDSTQLIELAPVLAQALGITVKDH